MMVDEICRVITDSRPYVPSEQVLIENIIAAVSEVREQHVKREFCKLLESHSMFVEGLLSGFFGQTFNVSAQEDPQLTPSFKMCLLDNKPKSLFNGQELEFSRFLDKFDNLRWLKAVPGFKVKFPYPTGTFYPDFVVAPTSDSGIPKATYYIETKGGHLLNSLDSQFKRQACSEISRLSEGRVVLIFGSFEECMQAIDEEFASSEARTALDHLPDKGGPASDLH